MKGNTYSGSLFAKCCESILVVEQFVSLGWRHGLIGERVIRRGVAAILHWRQGARSLGPWRLAWPVQDREVRLRECVADWLEINFRHILSEAVIRGAEDLVKLLGGLHQMLLELLVLATLARGLLQQGLHVGQAPDQLLDLSLTLLDVAVKLLLLLDEDLQLPLLAVNLLLLGLEAGLLLLCLSSQLVNLYRKVTLVNLS